MKRAQPTSTARSAPPLRAARYAPSSCGMPSERPKSPPVPVPTMPSAGRRAASRRWPAAGAVAGVPRPPAPPQQAVDDLVQGAVAAESDDERAAVPRRRGGQRRRVAAAPGLRDVELADGVADGRSRRGEVTAGAAAAGGRVGDDERARLRRRGCGRGPACRERVPDRRPLDARGRESPPPRQREAAMADSAPHPAERRALPGERGRAHRRLQRRRVRHRHHAARAAARDPVRGRRGRLGRAPGPARPTSSASPSASP